MADTDEKVWPANVSARERASEFRVHVPNPSAVHQDGRPVPPARAEGVRHARAWHLKVDLDADRLVVRALGGVVDRHGA